MPDVLNPIIKLNQRVVNKIKIIDFPTNIKNTRKRSEICAKFKIKTLETRQ